MGYLKITNLYKRPEYLHLFKTVYVLEKIHGTSAHISIDSNGVSLFSGGAKHEQFVELFDKDHLFEIYKNSSLADKKVVLYGEAYGGKMQGMSKTYGDKLSFIVFEIELTLNDGTEVWLEPPEAERWAKEFGQEFVWYTTCENTLENLDKYKNQPSQLSLAKGLGENLAEGIVTKPLYECYDRRGGRWILKHKIDKFGETKTPREVDPNKAQEVFRGQAVADEFVTEMRLSHVLDKGSYRSEKDIPALIQAMLDDIRTECGDEIEESKHVIRAVGGKTVALFKERLRYERLEKLVES